MSEHYILNGHEAVPAGLMEWASWLEKARAERVVAKTEISDGVRVSTVFLGLNYRFGEGPPLLFETLVFGGPWGGEMERCSTWAEAEAMHAQMCETVKLPRPTVAAGNA